jgi:hypothetical protein
MKIFHFTILFLIFLLAAIIGTDIKVGKLKAVENEKRELETSLESATSDAVNYLATSGTFGTNKINKEVVVTKFFRSLYSSMGIISDRNKQTEIEMYIPVILICDTDGYYLYYYDRYKNEEGVTYSTRIWSEKLPYYYEDGNFIYRFTLTDKIYIYDIHDILHTGVDVVEIDYQELQTDDAYEVFRNNYSDSFLLNEEKYELIKKEAIINQLSESLAYYTNKHNMIAQQNGITYTFSFPAGQEEEWAKYMNDVNLLVVFQGYPYGSDRNYTYNKVLSAGANVIKKDVYFVEQKSWYLIAHKNGCPLLAESTTVREETYETMEACAAIGAYCCECIEHGARVPDIP